MVAKRVYPIVPSPADDRDYKYLAKASSAVTYAELPPKVDLRDRLPPVRNQGSEGACAAFAGACMKEYQERVDIKLTSQLSPWFIYLQRENQGEEGMYLRDLMKILHKKGVCTEPRCKYQGSKEISQFARDEALNFRIKSYAQVNTQEELKRALYFHGPCVIAFPVYQHGTRFWAKPKPDAELIGGHAVAVVGYDDARGAFLIRNSWGLLFGSLGYTWYPYEEWGAHWEVWSSVDDRSAPMFDIEPDDKVCKCF
jgi:hypothetical protein